MTFGEMSERVSEKRTKMKMVERWHPSSAHTEQHESRKQVKHELEAKRAKEAAYVAMERAPYGM